MTDTITPAPQALAATKRRAIRDRYCQVIEQFVVVCQNVVGRDHYEIAYSCDGKVFHDREDAIAHGFTKGRSDDFNVGVLRNGRLVSLDWMQQSVDTDPALMATIAGQIGIGGEGR